MTRECLYVSTLREENSRKKRIYPTLIEGRLSGGAGKPKKVAETRVSVCHLIVKDGQNEPAKSEKKSSQSKKARKTTSQQRRQSISKSGKSKQLTKSPPMDEEPVGEPCRSA